MPVKLSKAAQAHWKRLVQILTGLKILTIADGDALGAYCSVLVHWEMATAAIAKYGILLVQLDKQTGVSVLKMNPAVRVQSDALRHMRGFESDFGLSPASRSRVQVTRDGETDPLYNFLNGKGDVVR